MMHPLKRIPREGRIKPSKGDERVVVSTSREERRKTTTSCARGHNDDSYSRFSRAPSPRLSLSACKVFCGGKFEFYVSVLQASFLECVCYMFRARMFYTIELELLLF